MKEAGLELMVVEAERWLWFLKSFALLLYVFENNIKLKLKRNIVLMPCLFQRNPLSGEISNNLVTGEYLGAQEFLWHFPNLISYFAFIYSTNFFFKSESVSVA